MPAEKMINNLKNCPRFPACSINKCPMDYGAELRVELPEEERCPFTIKKRKKYQRGIKTQASDGALKVIPKSNIKMLNKRNLRRWQNLHKKDGRKL